jgi:hypothetical protein
MVQSFRLLLLFRGHRMLFRQRTHQLITDKTQHQQAGQDHQRNIVDALGRDPVRQLILAQIVHQNRAADPRRRPGG